MIGRASLLAAVAVLLAGCSGRVIGSTADESVQSENYPVPAAYAKGDPVAGKTVFTTRSCNSCHTLMDARATGVVGPNLDVSKPSLGKTLDRVVNGKGTMASFKGALTTEQIADVSAYVVKATSG